MSETKSVFAAYSANTHLFGANGPYVEEMYENYLANPAAFPTTGANISTPSSTFLPSTAPTPRTFPTCR